MFARVSLYDGDPDALRAGFGSVTGELEGVDGFVKGYFMVNAAGKGVSVTLWDTEDALSASAAKADELRSRATAEARAVITSVESYEVAVTAG